MSLQNTGARRPRLRRGPGARVQLLPKAGRGASMVSRARAERQDRHRPQGWRASRGPAEPWSIADRRANPGVEGQPLELGCKRPMETWKIGSSWMGVMNGSRRGRAGGRLTAVACQVHRCATQALCRVFERECIHIWDLQQVSAVDQFTHGREGGNAWRGAAHGMCRICGGLHSLTLVQ